MKALDGWQGHGPWETWFAWYPLMMDGRPVWLQTVERRYQYRQINGVAQRRWMYQLLQTSGLTQSSSRG